MLQNLASFISGKSYALIFKGTVSHSPVLRARPGNFLGGIRGRKADHGSRAGRRRGDGTRRQRCGGRPRNQRSGGAGRRRRRRGGNGRGRGGGGRRTRGRGGRRRRGRNFCRGGHEGRRLFLRSGSCPTSTSHLQTVQYVL
jgi:hypothetical protein